MSEVLPSGLRTEIFESVKLRLFDVAVTAYLLGEGDKFDTATEFYQSLEPEGYEARLTSLERFYISDADRRMRDEIAGVMPARRPSRYFDSIEVMLFFSDRTI